MKTRNLEEYLVKQEEKKANLPSVTWPLLGKVSVVVEKLFIFAICVMKGTSVRWQLIFVCCSCKRLRWIIEIQRKQQLRSNENRLNRRLLSSGSSREFFVDECRSVVFSTTTKICSNGTRLYVGCRLLKDDDKQTEKKIQIQKYLQLLLEVC